MLLELSALSRRNWVQILPLQPTQAENLTSKPTFLAWTWMSTCTVRYQSLDLLTTGRLGCQYLEKCTYSESAGLGRSTSTCILVVPGRNSAGTPTIPRFSSCSTVSPGDYRRSWKRRITFPSHSFQIHSTDKVKIKLIQYRYIIDDSYIHLFTHPFIHSPTIKNNEQVKIQQIIQTTITYNPDATNFRPFYFRTTVRFTFQSPDGVTVNP